MQKCSWPWLVLLSLFFIGCSRSPRVVLYTSVDQVYAEQISHRFEEKTGIRVELLTDTEATKTVGLTQRLVAERVRPQADVFWNNEVLNTAALAQEGVLTAYRSPEAATIPNEWIDPEGRWVGFALRARAIVYNTEKVSRDEAPKSIFELTEPRWRGKVAMANPLFGTAFTHAVALFEHLGAERTKAFFRALKDNGTLIVDGNSMVRDLVARGDAWLGLTDTDDVFVGKAKGWKIDLVVPDQNGIGVCLIPNTVALVQGGRHAAEARKLIDFLVSAEIERLLAESEGHNTPVRPDVASPEPARLLLKARPMSVDWSKAAKRIREVRAFLEEVFLSK